MSYKFNPFTGKLDLTDSFYRGVLTSSPSSPVDGTWYVHSGESRVYYYYGGSWYYVGLTAAALNYLLKEDGDKLLLETGDKLALEG